MLFDIFLVILFLTLGAWLFYREYKRPEEPKSVPPYSLDLDVHVNIDNEGKVSTQVKDREKSSRDKKIQTGEIPIEPPKMDRNWKDIEVKAYNDK